ncbi:MAG: SUMF1/EgtB/PvdO family nonheme iron enzyme [bacterium]
MSRRSLVMPVITLLLLCLTGTFAWAAAPTITALAPPTAVVGAVVTITGTDLDKVTSVTFNGIAAKTITDNTATSLKVTVPEGATSGKLVVTTAGGTVTNSYDFIVLLGLKINDKDKAEMVWVPGATFTMGSAADVDFTNELPAHQVTLSGYWIYKNDVTVVQYRAFCTASGQALPAFSYNYSWKDSAGWDNPTLQQHPIVSVNWYQAKAYADWAGVKLPTEAQWEYAARGPQGNNYPWGGTATKNDKYNGWDATKCANYLNSYKDDKSTWPVGSFPAGTSWCGAQDMAGNVWQWCGDWFGYYAADAVTDPTGPTKGEYRVLRGGSWGNFGYAPGSGNYRCADRYCNNPSKYYYYAGFRCAVIAPGPK